MIRVMNQEQAPHPELPSAESATQMLRAAIGQLEFARRYTLELLDATPKEHWFEIPAELPTHVAWQVGHLTVSEYGLLMFRVRGRLPEDVKLIPSRFRKAFSRQSQPSIDLSKQPSADELLERLAQVHELALQVLESVDAATLMQPIELPYAGYPTVLGGIMFCPLHEHIHNGQIGLLRRALGLPSVR